MQPVVKVFAEASGLDLCLGSRLVAQTKRTSTCRSRVSPTRRKVPVCDEAQQLGLQREIHLADFVEEQRAAVGELRRARAVFVRAGEGALHVAEDFAFHQFSRDRAAIDAR